jgi:F0F1-type ATP synthase membrane subunit a
LFGNIFSDEKVAATMAGIFPPYTYWIVPIHLGLMVLSIFVAFVQTFVFILLSQLYLSEVTHDSHDEHEHDEHAETSTHAHARAEALAAS